MCNCNDTGRRYEVQGAITIYAPCPDCPEEVREARRKIAKDRLERRLKDARAKMRREQHVTEEGVEASEGRRGA